MNKTDEKETNNKIDKMKKQNIKEELIRKSKYNYDLDIKPRHKLMAKYCKEGLTLDLGCASKPNFFLKNVIGCDMVIREMPNNYVSFIQADLDVSFPKVKADNITAGEVIEHLENPIKFLKDCYEKLNLRGRLIITTINTLYYYRYFPKKRGYNDHWIEFDYVTLKRTMEKVGFKIIVIRGTYLKLPLISRIKKLEYIWTKNKLLSADFMIVGEK